MGIDGKAWSQKIIENIAQVIIGKEESSMLLLTAMVAEGHVLLEDVPGTGKTKLAKSMARSMTADFSRIQFTPDLLPSDVTGLNIYDRQSNAFTLRKGPVFTNILLADEINRATPRTQAGLLECMEERQVTIDGVSHELKSPFMVIATQNPLETAGTFPLPEAQMDRFVMKLSMGLPGREEELRILEKYMEKDPLSELKPVFSLQELQEVKAEAAGVFVHKSIREYMIDIIEATRSREEVISGVSTRGSLSLLKCVKAYACLNGRGFVIPDDVKAMAVPVLAHRLVMSYGYARNGEEKAAVQKILASVEVPTEEFA